MIEPGHIRHQHVCACGHRRQAHIDAFQRCDHCDCRTYRGVIPELPDSGIYAPPGVTF